MNKTNTTFSTPTLAIQSWLRPELTPVKSNVDYSRFKEDLDRISANLRDGWLEATAIDYALEGLPDGVPQSARVRRAEFAVFALRSEVLRHLLGLPSLRAYSRMLAGSDLLADFCGVRTLEGIKWTSETLCSSAKAPAVSFSTTSFTSAARPPDAVKLAESLERQQAFQIDQPIEKAKSAAARPRRTSRF